MRMRMCQGCSHPYNIKHEYIEPLLRHAAGILQSTRLMIPRVVRFTRTIRTLNKITGMTMIKSYQGRHISIRAGSTLQQMNTGHFLTITTPTTGSTAGTHISPTKWS